MTPDPATCSLSDNLDAVALQMWDRGCGILPIVHEGRVQGVITERDICMALIFKGAKPVGVTVAEIFSGQIYGCNPEDDVTAALAIMQKHQVHRVPVIEDGRLAGVLSINDIVQAAKAPRRD